MREAIIESKKGKEKKGEKEAMKKGKEKRKKE